MIFSERGNRRQSIVNRRLENPKVHSFLLSHLAAQPGTLLIQFDVDDKATYEMLESDYLVMTAIRPHAST